MGHELSERIRARLARHDAEAMARKKKRRNAQKLRSERLRNGVDTANMRKTLDGQPRTPVSLAQKLVAIRLPPQMIEDVKVQASRFDMTWQPFMRLLVLQGLHHLSEHDSLDIPTNTDAEAKALRAQQRAALVAERKAAQEEQTPTTAPKQKRQKKGAPSGTPVATNGTHEPLTGIVDTSPEPLHEPFVSTDLPTNGHEALVATREVLDEAAPYVDPPTVEAHSSEPSKAALLRQMLEEHEGPLPTIPAGPPTSSEPEDDEEAPRDVLTPPGPGYVLAQMSESNEEQRIARELDLPSFTPEEMQAVEEHELPTYVRPSAPEGSVIQSNMNGSALHLVSTTPVSEPILSKEATSEEIDALLGGDSALSGDVEVSAEDMMEAVLNQFGPSEAEPEVASASDESTPHLPHTPESSEDDFQDLLNSL